VSKFTFRPPGLQNINWQKGPCHLKEYLHYPHTKKLLTQICAAHPTFVKNVFIKGAVAQKCLNSGFEAAFPVHDYLIFYDLEFFKNLSIFST
jgi:hypothetical protein